MSNGSGAAVTGLVIGLIMALGVGASDNPDSGSSSESAGSSAAGSGSGTPDSVPTATSAGTVWGLDVPGVIQTTGRSGQTVSLTFSAGPDPRWTPQVLDILDARGVDATFCVIGSEAEDRPGLIRQIAAEGHVLCDQTMTHDHRLAARDDATMGAEIGAALTAIRAAVPDARVPFFRAPGGNFSPELVAVAESFDQTSLGWNVDPRDWEAPGAVAIRTSVLEAVQPGSVILLHDGGADRAGTVDALGGIIDGLTADGYQFVIPAS